MNRKHSMTRFRLGLLAHSPQWASPKARAAPQGRTVAVARLSIGGDGTAPPTRPDGTSVRVLIETNGGSRPGNDIGAHDGSGRGQGRGGCRPGHAGRRPRQTDFVSVEPKPDARAGGPDKGVGGVADAGPGARRQGAGVPIGFVRIEPGTFMMGSPEDEAGRQPDETQHEVTLTHAFLIQATEVTQQQALPLAGDIVPYFPCGDDCPVETASFSDAIAYANLVSRTEGLPECYSPNGAQVAGATVYDCVGYRLPTEAEWEYAARVGRDWSHQRRRTHRHGLTDTALLAIAWFCGNSGKLTHPVAQLAPNPWARTSMPGNAWEWTNDWYGDYPGAATDPVGPGFTAVKGRRAAADGTPRPERVNDFETPGNRDEGRSAMLRRGRTCRVVHGRTAWRGALLSPAWVETSRTMRPRTAWRALRERPSGPGRVGVSAGHAGDAPAADWARRKGG